VERSIGSSLWMRWTVASIWMTRVPWPVSLRRWTCVLQARMSFSPASVLRLQSGPKAAVWLRVAALPEVRTALLDRQRAFRQHPGLVADGRDMGSVVFPDARLKVYLVANPETRAERRYKQLRDKGIAANIDVLLLDLAERDARDIARAVAPLKPAPDARILDTTGLTAERAAEAVLAWYREVSQGDR
jgi:cytidylate kinase